MAKAKAKAKTKAKIELSKVAPLPGNLTNRTCAHCGTAIDPATDCCESCGCGTIAPAPDNP